MFARIHIDTKHMPSFEGFHYIVQTRCSLIEYSEFHLLRRETREAIEKFIFEELLCRYEACSKLVIDNEKSFVSALE